MSPLVTASTLGQLNMETMNLPQSSTKNCTLHDVLLVPDLAFNLLSITAASKIAKVTTFIQVGCEMRDFKSKLVASEHRDGSLYYLDQGGPSHQACVRNSSERTITLREPSGIVAWVTWEMQELKNWPDTRWSGDRTSTRKKN